MEEIIRYTTKKLLDKFYQDKDELSLLNRALNVPLVDKKRDIDISIPIKIIIPNKVKENERSN